jgi:oligoribonuclease (3'-5' exoribonuclease)
LGGSGVERFESHFFRLQLPLLYERLFYWSQDVGNVRRFAKLRGVEAPATTRVADTGNHRAESDIDQHIAESKWFLRLFEAARAAGIPEQLAREDAKASGLV